MSDGHLSDRVKALIEADGPPVRLNMMLRSGFTAAEREVVLEEISRIAASPVTFRAIAGVATVEVPRRLVRDLARISGIEEIDLDATASYLELTD